jgi:hypothetical protein
VTNDFLSPCFQPACVSDIPSASEKEGLHLKSYKTWKTCKLGTVSISLSAALYMWNCTVSHGIQSPQACLLCSSFSLDINRRIFPSVMIIKEGVHLRGEHRLRQKDRHLFEWPLPSSQSLFVMDNHACILGLSWGWWWCYKDLVRHSTTCLGPQHPCWSPSLHKQKALNCWPHTSRWLKTYVSV